MYSTGKHGRADYGKYMQIPESILSGVVEGANGTPLEQQKFAQFTYQVNASPIQISGDVVVDAVGLDDTGTVKLSGDSLKVFDQASVDAINNISFSTENYSSVIQTRGTDNYIAEASIGTAYATASWRVQKIDSTGTTTWVDSGNFSQAANIELSGLTYNP